MIKIKLKINKLIFSIFTVLLFSLSSVQGLYALDNNLNNNSNNNNNNNGEEKDLGDKPREKFDIEELPNEMLLQILSNFINVYSANQKEIEEGIKTLRSLSLTNRFFYELISDDKFTQYILEALKNSTNISPNFYIQATLFLDTPAAREWLSKNLIIKNLNKINKLLEKKDHSVDQYKKNNIIDEDELKEIELRYDNKIVDLFSFIDNIFSLKNKSAFNLLEDIVLDIQNNKAELSSYLGMKLDQLLLQAAKNGSRKEVKILLKLGANANTVDEDGNTPLMVAAREGNFEAIATLLSKKIINITAINNNWETALNLARNNNHIKIANYIMMFQKAFPPNLPKRKK